MSLSVKETEAGIKLKRPQMNNRIFANDVLASSLEGNQINKISRHRVTKPVEKPA